ncbi:hypothetical protein [Mycolicibacterium frederiksbergense]|uniref:hypothetical protein n=1 Tax=Mycolicibacterium frederiksbergense TaxID=117567 RepID=UPI00143B4F8C|nr:hypothetical protein [Mycolicibacterium frederiksbergense]
MSTMMMAGHAVHVVSGDDWHSWLLMLGVIVACWVAALLAIRALFAGPTRTARPYPVSGGGRGEDAAIEYAPRNDRRV